MFYSLYSKAKLNIYIQLYNFFNEIFKKVRKLLVPNLVRPQDSAALILSEEGIAGSS